MNNLRKENNEWKKKKRWSEEDRKKEEEWNEWKKERKRKKDFKNKMAAKYRAFYSNWPIYFSSNAIIKLIYVSKQKLFMANPNFHQDHPTIK